MRFVQNVQFRPTVSARYALMQMSASRRSGMHSEHRTARASPAPLGLLQHEPITVMVYPATID